METKQIVVRQIPIALWKKLKIKAAIEDDTLQCALAKAIEQYVEKSA
jgi:hypothetical protein